MKKNSVLSILFLFVIWCCLTVVFNNSILMPGPFDVVDAMIHQLFSDVFMTSIIATSLRTLEGVFLSLLSGGLLGILSGQNQSFKAFFAPIHHIIKTIPNITYMILILIWLGQENSVTVIVFCILFPVFYDQFLFSTEKIVTHTNDLLQIYPVSSCEKWFKIILPMLKDDFFASLKTGIGMGFKVCVMAEILGQVKNGIGRQMNYHRLNLEIASVFGWTCWLIFISIFLQKCIDIVQKITNKKMN